MISDLRLKRWMEHDIEKSNGTRYPTLDWKYDNQNI